MSEAELSVIALSAKVAVTSTLLALVPGVFVAWLLARRRFVGRVFLEALVSLPLVLPPVVTGYLLLIAFGRNGPVGRVLEGSFGVVLAFQWTGAALAAAVMAFPLFVRAVRLSIESVDPRLEAAARTLGAGPLAAFFRVTLPLSFPGLLAGAVLAFARSLGEFGATITFAGNVPGRTRTIALAVYSLTQTPDGEVAALRLVAVSVALSLAALVASELLVRRATVRAPSADLR